MVALAWALIYTMVNQNDLLFGFRSTFLSLKVSFSKLPCCRQVFTGLPCRSADRAIKFWGWLTALFFFLKFEVNGTDRLILWKIIVESY